jgi:hypothetical protein
VSRGNYIDLPVAPIISSGLLLYYLSPAQISLTPRARAERSSQQSRGPIQARHGPGGCDALETAVADKLAHNGAVLLFDPSLVIFAVWARAAELDSVA